MRTLFITEWFRPDVGGSITWYENVYSRYPRGEVFILAKKTAGDRVYDGTAPFVIERVSYRRYPFLKPESLCIYIASLWKALRMVKRYGIQLVHCDKVLPAGLVAFYLKKVTGLSYITYCHGEEVSTYLAYPGAVKAMVRVYNAASKVIVNSEFTKKLLVGIGVFSGHIVVVHPGVNCEIFRPGIPCDEMRKRHGLESRRILLTVGRLQRRKGHDAVIVAMAELARKFPDLAYLVVSDGEERPYLQALAAEVGVQDKVIFVGRIHQDELPAYFNLSDIFIMANRMLPGGDVEGFGIVFLEAGACGKPVIGGNSGGAPEAIRNGLSGYVIDGTKRNEIVDTVSGLLMHPELMEEMGRAGRAWVSDHFSWDEITKQIRILR